MLQVLHRKEAIWIVPLVEISRENHAIFERQIEWALSGLADCVVLDFSKIDYMHSTSITLLIRLQRQIIGKGGSFYIVNISRSCRRILEAIRLDKVFAIFDSEEQFNEHGKALQRK